LLWGVFVGCCFLLVGLGGFFGSRWLGGGWGGGGRPEGDVREGGLEEMD